MGYLWVFCGDCEVYWGIRKEGERDWGMIGYFEVIVERNWGLKERERGIRGIFGYFMGIVKCIPTGGLGKRGRGIGNG